MLGCATAEQPPVAGDDSPGAGGGGASSAGGSGAVSGSASGGSPGSSGTLGASGSANNAGSSGVAHGGLGGSSGASANGGTSATGGAHAGGSGGTNSGGTSSGGTSTGGTNAGGTSSAGTTGIAGSSPGGASGTVLFSDDFEDGKTDKWVAASGGTWAIVTDGSKAYAQTASGAGSTVLLSAAGSTAWTDQIVEARVKVLAFSGQGTSYYAGIFARYDGTDYYSLLLRSDGKLVIRKDTSSIGNAVSAGIATGTWYTVRFEVVGSTLKAYLNGVLQSTVTDTTLTAGGIAVSVDNTTAEFDDVKVTKP